MLQKTKIAVWAALLLAVACADDSGTTINIDNVPAGATVTCSCTPDECAVKADGRTFESTGTVIINGTEVQRDGKCVHESIKAGPPHRSADLNAS